MITQIAIVQYSMNITPHLVCGALIEIDDTPEPAKPGS